MQTTQATTQNSHAMDTGSLPLGGACPIAGPIGTLQIQTQTALPGQQFEWASASCSAAATEFLELSFWFLLGRRACPDHLRAPNHSGAREVMLGYRRLCFCKPGTTNEQDQQQLAYTHTRWLCASSSAQSWLCADDSAQLTLCKIALRN